MRKNFIIPKSVLMGITKNDKNLNENFIVFGCDTESYKGKPILLQIKDDKDLKIFEVNEKNILKTFLDYLDKKLQRNQIGIAFFHNLSYDLVELFYGFDLTKFNYNTFKVKLFGWNIEVFCGKTYFAKFNKGKHKTIWVLDSYAFIPFSLKNIAKALNLKYEKLKAPKGLGEKRFTLKDREFIEYSKQDVRIEKEIADWIMGIHKQFKVRLSVSLPHLCSIIFRHYFLKEGERIPLPPPNILNSALRSYHGGKNGLYIKGGFYENVSEIDLNSAYPYAMSVLPSFIEGEYVPVKDINFDYVGIYNISGEVNCPYNIFFNDEFRPVQGKFKDIWVTSYELEEALLHNEVKLKSVFGYIWKPYSDRNPFKDYVDYFYKKKQETPKDNPLYIFYKLALNSLYGKLIQLTERRDEDTLFLDYEEIETTTGEIKLKRVQKTYVAGGMFNPFIATLITGKVRAMIHNLEHKYEAIHTATDSIKTFKKVEKESKELGGYKLEVKGDCLILRNKFYLHFDENGVLKKYATHGFQGSVLDVIKLYESKGHKYNVNHLFKVREAMRQNKIPLMMENVERNLLIDWDNINYKDIDWKKYYMIDKETGEKISIYDLIKK